MFFFCSRFLIVPFPDHCLLLALVTELPPIGKIAVHLAYDMLSLYKYLIVSLFFFPHLGFLFAPFPDLCLLVPFYLSTRILINDCDKLITIFLALFADT